MNEAGGIRLRGFDFHPRTRLIFGVNAIDRLGELARELGARRVLLVTSAGVRSAGHAERASRSLEAAGVTPLLYDRAPEDPSARDVDECAVFARDLNVDTIVGLGGGSAIDTAKGCNFLLTNGGRMPDYRGFRKASRPLLPLIAVPTTSGTGSECQSYALICHDGTHQKMACGDPKAAPAIAVLDPTLTLTQPRTVTAFSGLDAIGHAVETAVTRGRNELSLLHSREAFRLLIGSFSRVLTHPDDLEARASMQLGAAHAGIAIELSMLGAAHAAANPLGANWGAAHGQAVGMMLPAVVRFNAGDRAAREGYRDLLGYAGLAEAGADPAATAASLADRLEDLLAVSAVPSCLSELKGAALEGIPRLAVEAAAQGTARFNPRDVTAEDFESLYRASWSRKADPVRRSK
ncbi:MAG TPA: iron-containing alcohol dehydrogenase [Planctomycetota bacterium]|nr:iron-containing alcohol dehydrogenase [Planctomycetota bacterium]